MAKRHETSDPDPSSDEEEEASCASTAPSSKPESRAKRLKVDVVQSINDLAADQFRARFIPQPLLSYSYPTASFDIEHKSSQTLLHAELDDCFRLIEKTSAHDYRASTIGWMPQSKRKEMKDTLIHYLLVRLDRPSAGVDGVTADDDAGQVFAGFLSFMVTYDSSPSVPVLYVYEIHLAEPFRKYGLGKHLLDLASTIAAKAGMSKVMLTCFVSNDRARRFYERYGFEKDAVSPNDRRTRGRIIVADHIIMSKSA